MLAEPDSRLPSEQRATVWAGLALVDAVMGHADAAASARLMPGGIAGRVSLFPTLVV